MDKAQAQQTLDKIIAEILEVENPMNLSDFQQQYAFDIPLPKEASSSISGKTTWASSINPARLITQAEMREEMENTDWMYEKQPLHNIQDILEAWSRVNLKLTEKRINSTNVARSDAIINSQNIWRSQYVTKCKNIIMSDTLTNCEYVAAGYRSHNSTFCARLQDSQKCSNSFNVSWSTKVAKSMFIHNAYDIYECMFSSHLTSKRYVIANMQFAEEEYYQLKEKVIAWLLDRQNL